MKSRLTACDVDVIEQRTVTVIAAVIFLWAVGALVMEYFPLIWRMLV